MLKLPKEIIIDLAKRVRLVRKKKGISQQKMAEKSGVSLGSIKRFESTGKISIESLLQIAMVLGHLSDFEKLFDSSKLPDTLDDLFK